VVPIKQRLLLSQLEASLKQVISLRATANVAKLCINNITEKKQLFDLGSSLPNLISV
jgi:hypothetical protein